MNNPRASIFDTADLDAFTPKSGPAPDALPPEQVRAITEASQFPSREAKPRAVRAQPVAPPPVAPVAPAAKPVRASRRLRTYRTEQLNVRASAKTIEDFYAIADQLGWKASETFERAVEALKRETAGQGRGGA